MSTPPTGIIFARPITSLPVAEAGVITESHFILFCVPQWALYGFAAAIACLRNSALPSGRIFANKTPIKRSRHAITRTIIVPSVARTVSRTTIKLLAALRADQVTRRPLRATSPCLFWHLLLLCHANNYTIKSPDVKSMGIGNECQPAAHVNGKLEYA
jgi:hypothetical protein